MKSRFRQWLLDGADLEISLALEHLNRHLRELREIQSDLLKAELETNQLLRLLLQRSDSLRNFPETHDIPRDR